MLAQVRVVHRRGAQYTSRRNANSQNNADVATMMRRYPNRRRINNPYCILIIPPLIPLSSSPLTFNPQHSQPNQQCRSTDNGQTDPPFARVARHLRLCGDEPSSSQANKLPASTSSNTSRIVKPVPDQRALASSSSLLHPCNSEYQTQSKLG